MSTELMVPEVVTLKLRWYEFRQNNSGGTYHVNEHEAHWVFVQAASAEEAVARFEPCANNMDSCQCCGDRWSIDWVDESDAADVPSIYGVPLHLYVDESWTRSYPEARLYKYDGTILSTPLRTKHDDQRQISVTLAIE